MSKNLALIAVLASLYGNESIPISLEISQSCRVENNGAFQNTQEYYLFDSTIKDPSAISDFDGVEEIGLWADGKNYPIYSSLARTYPVKGGRTVSQLYGNELKSILSAGFVKLRIKYKDQVQEEQSSQGSSPYFSRTKTTITKESFVPVKLDRDQIQAAYNECDHAIAKAKQHQFILEILIGTGISVIFATLLLVLWKIRRKFRINRSAEEE